MSDVQKLIDNIDTMPAGTREAIIDSLLAKREERRQFASGLTPLKTVQASAAADPRNRVMLREVVLRCARLGYDIEDDKLIDVRALDKALKERNVSIEERVALKTSLAQLGLIR
jgi:hypothetical protein